MNTKTSDLLSQLPEHQLCVLRGAPGSGKSELAIDAAIEAFYRGERVLFATLSNTQSFDIARRITRKSPQTRVLLYHRSGLQIPELVHSNGLQSVTGSRPFIEGPCIVLSNATKWAWIKDPIPHFSLMIIDDAGGIRESLFMQISGLADRYLIVGDWNHSEPIIRSDVRRWGHKPTAPHKSIIETSLLHYPKALLHELNYSYRLPLDTIKILFPDVFPQELQLHAQPRVLSVPHSSSPIWKGVSKGESLVIAQLDHTDELRAAQWMAKSIRELLEQECHITDTRMEGKLNPAKIGIVCAEHRQVLMVERALGSLAQDIHVDIHLHFHSQERALIFAFHPFFQQPPSPYNWDIANLALLLTRHRAACVLVTPRFSLHHPKSMRGLFAHKDPLLDSYQAHKTLMEKLQHRIYLQ